jgi:hypothetical protein
MAIDEKDFLHTRVDVGVLKEQVASIATLCGKMDVVIQKLVDQNDRNITEVYRELEIRRTETNNNFREVHDRIDTIISETNATKVSIVQSIVDCKTDHNTEIGKIQEWRWKIVGGIIGISFVISILAQYFLPQLPLTK